MDLLSKPVDDDDGLACQQTLGVGTRDKEIPLTSPPFFSSPLRAATDAQTPNDGQTPFPSDKRPYFATVVGDKFRAGR